MTNHLYNILLKRGLTTSQRDFSSRWCDRAPNYIATQIEPSPGAMITVFHKLLAQGRILLACRVARMVLFGRPPARER